MAKPPRPWIVTPHSPLQKLEDNLWLVTSPVPGFSMHRRMSIMKRSDGKLVFYNAVPLEDSALAEVTAWGKPGYLMIPHDQHGIDASAFAAKLGIGIYGPRASEARMRARFNLAGTIEDIPPDAHVSLESIADTKSGEPVA